MISRTLRYSAKMWVFLCAVALCTLLTPSSTLLTPSQGSETALVQKTMGKDDLLNLIKVDLSLLPINELLGSGQNGGGGLLDHGNIRRTDTGSLGLKIQKAELLKLDLDMTGNNMKVMLRTELTIKLVYLGNLIPVNRLTVGGLSDAELKVSLYTTIPLQLSVNKRYELELVLDNDKYKILELKIEPFPGCLLSSLSTITNILSRPLGGILSPRLCKVLASAIKVANEGLKPVREFSPIGNTGHVVECAVTAVKKVFECFVVDISVKLNGKPITVQSASGPVHLPKLNYGGIAIHKALLQACLRDQIPLEWINSQIALKGITVVTAPTVSECMPGAEVNEALNLKINMISSPNIILEKYGMFMIETVVEVEANGAKSNEQFFVAELSVKVNAIPHMTRQRMLAALELDSVLSIKVTARYTFNMPILQEQFTKSAEKIVSAFNDANLWFPAPQMTSGTPYGTVTIVEDGVIVTP